jgi:DNA-binding XRE family transcriptional regulator
VNQIERLQADLARRFPDLETELDAPIKATSPWFLDVLRESLPRVVIEWRPDRGFGVSTPGPEDYGMGPDEVYPNLGAAFDRVIQLVETKGAARPPEAIRLAELRQARRLSQAELANRAGIKQPTIAGIEDRDDIKLSTLTKVVGAMGAKLRISALFEDGMERELKF